jgi:3-oxoadipate enol-lactonase
VNTTRTEWERDGIAVTEYRPDGDHERTLIFLSSLGVSRRCWEGVANELGTRHRCLAIDIPGHGTAPAAPNFMTMPDFAGAIGALIDNLGEASGGRVAVVGNSMGATIGTALADARPDLVSHLVHVGSAVWESETARRQWLHSRSALFCRSDGSVREMTGEFVEAIFGRYDADSHRMLREDQERSGPRLGWAMWALYAYDTPTALGRLRQPVLAVFGERDPYREVSLPVLRQSLRRLDEVVIPGGSHLLPVDCGPELAAHIHDWLTATSAHIRPKEMA